MGSSVVWTLAKGRISEHEEVSKETAQPEMQREKKRMERKKSNTTEHTKTGIILKRETYT